MIPAEVYHRCALEVRKETAILIILFYEIGNVILYNSVTGSTHLAIRFSFEEFCKYNTSSENRLSCELHYLLHHK